MFGAVNNSSLTCNDNGQVAFVTSLTGPTVTTADDSAVFVGTAGNWTMLAREGDVLPIPASFGGPWTCGGLNDFLHEFGTRMGKSDDGLTREARDRLLSYSWPGNIRELSNAIERALILSDGGAIGPEQLGLPMPGAATQGNGEHGSVLGGTLPEVERRLVTEALERTGGNKLRAAAALGVTRSQLYTRIKNHGIAAP
jgi:hypothetical protein